MAEQYRLQIENKMIHDLSFEERLAMLVDAEWQSRQNNRLKRLIKKADLKDDQACLEGIDYHPKRKLNKLLISRLSTGHWLEQNQNLLITGSSGSGKTYLSCAFGNMACRLGYTVAYVRVPRLLIQLNIAKSDGTFTKQMNNLKRTDLLILDDWGLAEFNQQDSRDILEIIDDKVKSGSIVITSQLPIDSWHELFTDPTLADAIVDRLAYSSHKIEIDSIDSMRKITSEL